jgi:hypothetical protein
MSPSHLQSQKVCNMFELTMRFNSSADVLRDMLNMWIRKGKVRCCRKTNQCGTQCVKCHPLITELYEWIDE